MFGGALLLAVGFAAGEIPKLPLNLALLSERSLLGVYWGDWSLRNRAASTAQLARIAADIVAGALKPAISARVRPRLTRLASTTPYNRGMPPK